MRVHNQFETLLGLDNPAYSVPVWNILVNGFPIGLPVFDAGLNQLITNRAYTQVWFGQYIDWTNPTNLQQVLTSDGKPPTNPATASNFFGVPQLYFYRDKNNAITFQKNNGTGGSFSVVGTSPADFTPGPQIA